MESANKAITMAFGMIVGVLILSAIVYVFTNLKALPTQEDENESLEQITAFNKEYEVYDKKIMYGVDVISVLNKALSNNEKYVQGNFLSGEGYNTDYLVDIQVKLKNTLEETIEVTYIDDSGSTVMESKYADGRGPNYISAADKFTAPDSTYCGLVYSYSNLWNSLKLQTQTITTKVTSGVYHLLAINNASSVDYTPSTGNYGEYDSSTMDFTGVDPEDETTLQTLLSYSATMSQTVKNSGGNTTIAGTVYSFDDSTTGWNKATWYPAIYDLKTRKFKCTNLVYSEKTSRVIVMAFEEI